MPQEDSPTIAPYYDGSSTESESYDEKLLELAVSTNNASNDQNLAPDEFNAVKIEVVDDTNVKGEPLDVIATEETETKTKSTHGKCKRCRRKLPVVSEKEQTEVKQGTINTKRCACCCENYPLSKFGSSSRKAGCAIPRCRSCSQAPAKILQTLRKSPEFAEAFAVEKKKRTAERAERKTKLPPFERKTMKQRYEEQFQLVGGKTARERRLTRRQDEKKKRLASMQQKRRENHKK